MQQTPWRFPTANSADRWCAAVLWARSHIYVAGSPGFVASDVDAVEEVVEDVGRRVFGGVLWCKPSNMCSVIA
jgi:hypothetical protein